MSKQPRGHLAAARVVLALAVLAALAWVALPSADAPEFSAWSAPVNLGKGINTTYHDTCTSVSKDGLSLYFASGRPTGTNTYWDLWVAQRASTDDEWGGPQALGANINTGASESCPALSLDEHRLYFISRGNCGGAPNQDIFVSRRHDRRYDFGWEPAENLGCIADGYVNGPTNEGTPAFFEDESGRVIMYFSKDGDIYASVMRNDDSFGPPESVVELNAPAPYADNGAAIRRDGLEVIFSSNRPGSTLGSDGKPSYDLWMAARDSTSDLWSAPVILGNLNSPKTDGGRMSLSFDGSTLYFTSDRDGGEGGRDLYMATRAKLHGRGHNELNRDKAGRRTPAGR